MSAADSNPRWTTRIAVLKRSAKATKGGRRFSFGALAIVGNTHGSIGLGWGKSSEAVSAMHKAEKAAVAQQVQVALKAGRIAHEVEGHYCGATVLLRPAPPGTGIIAGKTIRQVLECAGVKDVVSKSLGARNPANVAKATIRALRSLRIKAGRVQYPVVKLPRLEAGPGDPFRLN